MLFDRAHHIGLSACFGKGVIDYRQSILKRVVESAFRISLLKGLICYSVEHSILVSRRFLSGYLLSFGSLF